MCPCQLDPFAVARNIHRRPGLVPNNKYWVKQKVSRVWEYFVLALQALLKLATEKLSPKRFPLLVTAEVKPPALPFPLPRRAGSVPGSARCLKPCGTDVAIIKDCV